MNKKLMKLLCLTVVAALLFSLLAIPVMADENISVMLNGEELTFDVSPQIINDRTMVPMRRIFEALGAEVEWINDTQTIVATHGERSIIMQIGNTEMSISESPYISFIATTTLDVPPMIIDDRTLVPIRAVAEGLNAEVEWINDTRTVVIETITVAPDVTVTTAPSVSLRATVTVMEIGAAATANRDKDIMAGVSLYNDRGENVTSQFYFGRITLTRGTQIITGDINSKANTQDHAFNFTANWNPEQTVDVTVEVRYSTEDFVELTARNIMIYDMVQALQNLLPGLIIEVN